MVFSSFGITSPSFYSSLGFYSAVYIPPYRKWHKNLGQSLCTSCTLMMMMCRMCLVPASSILYLLKLFNRMTVCSGSFSSIFFFWFYFVWPGYNKQTTSRQENPEQNRNQTRTPHTYTIPSRFCTNIVKVQKKRKEMRGGENLKLHTLFGWVGGGKKVGATGVCLSCWGNKKKIYSKAKAKANALARNWQLG